MLDRATNPIIHGIAESFAKFKTEFYLRNKNFLDSSIVGNPILINNLQRPHPVFNSVWANENGRVQIEFLKGK
jgi:hypothetical protein